MSTKLLTALSSCPVDLATTVGLNSVCIDNDQVRKRILKNGKIDINTVPCVLIVYRSGGVEKYEGVGAFQWIEEAVSKFAPPPPPPPPPPQPAPQPAPQRVVLPRPRQVEYEEEYEEEEYIPEPPRRKVKQALKRSKKQTTMEELGFEPLSEELVESDKTSSKSSDLMSAAAAMQKERDSVETGKGVMNIITNQGPI